MTPDTHTQHPTTSISTRGLSGASASNLTYLESDMRDLGKRVTVLEVNMATALTELKGAFTSLQDTVTDLKDHYVRTSDYYQSLLYKALKVLVLWGGLLLLVQVFGSEVVQQWIGTRITGAPGTVTTSTPN